MWWNRTNNFDNRIRVLKAHVLVNKTVIEGNWNIVPYTDIKIAGQVHAKEPKAISAFAAGMTVIFSQGNYSANVLLSHGYWIGDIGGVFDGLAIIFSDAPVRNTSVTVISSIIYHNLYHGNYDAFRIDCMVSTTLNDRNTHEELWDILTITDSKIYDSHNTYHYTSNDFNSYITSNQYNHSIIHIITSSSMFVNLRIHLEHLDYAQYYIGIRNPFILSESSKEHKNLQLVLQSINVYGWSLSLNTGLDVGKMVFFNTKSVYINGEINVFENITGSIILAYNSDIHLNGTITFKDNKASHGAAIRLDSSSYLFIHESTKASFIKNHASFYGGAIYSHIERNLPTAIPLCAIQVVSQNISHLNATLIFKKNTATLAGGSIYVSPLYDCQQLYLKEINSSHLYQKLFHFEAKDNDSLFSQISSVPVRTHHCNVNNIDNIDQIKVYPGETITIGLKAYDLNNNPTYVQIFTRLTKFKKFWHEGGRHTYSVDITHLLPVRQQIQPVYSNSCTSLYFTIFSENVSDLMYLHFEVLAYIPTTKVKLISKPCPPGFIYSSETKACVCSLFLKRFGITQCNINTSAINIPSQSWLGVLDNEITIAYTEHCPPGYCLPNTTINITQPDVMYRGNRMGWLCGQCKEGYSIVLGSTDCYKCSNTLHSVLAISFGILGGIVYVLVLFSLRLTIDLGTLGGFIFWLNIIWPYAIPSSDVNIKNIHLQYIVYFLTSIKYQWNIPVCIKNDLNELG